MKRAPCEECGGDAIPHRLTYITVLIDTIAEPLFAPGPILRVIGKGAHRFTASVFPRLMMLFTKVRLATTISRPDDFTPLLGQMLWQEADARGIKVVEWRLFNLPRNMYIATFPTGRMISYEGIPLRDNGIGRVWWMDNKYILKERFRKLGLPVARGGSHVSQTGARREFEKLNTTVIVKPHSGSASRHTTLHITDEKELERAFAVAKEVSPIVVVEEELKGPVYRATVVAGKFAALLRRDPPHIVGDGARTITELVAEANKNPKRSGPYFHQMKLDDAAIEELAYQNLTLESVPSIGEYVALNQKVNWSVGGTTADATDNVHPDNIELWEKATKLLRADIVGIDFIMQDPTRSWKEQEKCGFLECNSMPFFDNHHLPFEGQPRNIAATIWDMDS